MFKRISILIVCMVVLLGCSNENNEFDDNLQETIDEMSKLILNNEEKHTQLKQDLDSKQQDLDSKQQELNVALTKINELEDELVTLKNENIVLSDKLLMISENYLSDFYGMNSKLLKSSFLEAYNFTQAYDSYSYFTVSYERPEKIFYKDGQAIDVIKDWHLLEYNGDFLTLDTLKEIIGQYYTTSVVNSYIDKIKPLSYENKNDFVAIRTFNNYIFSNEIDGGVSTEKEIHYEKSFFTEYDSQSVIVHTPVIYYNEDHSLITKTKLISHKYTLDHIDGKIKFNEKIYIER